MAGCSKALRNPHKCDLCVLASSSFRELPGNVGTQVGACVHVCGRVCNSYDCGVVQSVI